jgi:hypothetical protein
MIVTRSLSPASWRKASEMATHGEFRAFGIVMQATKNDVGFLFSRLTGCTSSRL